MRATLRKLRSDLRTNRTQRLVIILLLTVATAALTTSLTVWARGGTAWEALYSEANGAHAWFYGEDSSLEAVKARPEIRESTALYPMAQVQVPAAQTPFGHGFLLWLQGLGTEQPGIDRPVLTSGRWVKNAGEVVLSRRFAADFGYEPGDTISVATATGSHDLRVTGIAVFAGRSPFSMPALAWTTPETVEQTGSMQPSFFALGVQLSNRAQVRAFRDALERDFGEDAFLTVDDWNGVRASNDEATEVITTFLGIFSLFALISAGFVITNAISARVIARYRDIGLLKAIGFTPRQVVSGLVLEQCGMALVSVIVGIAAGTLLVPLLDDPASREFETRSLGDFRPGVAFVIAAGVVALVALATLIPAWRAGRIPVVQAITIGPNRVSSRPSAVAGAANLLRLPAWMVVGVKDAFDRPVRSWLTVAALTLSVVTVTFVFTTEWTIRQLVSNPALIGEPFELQVDGENMAALESAIKADPQVRAYFERGVLSVTPDGKDEEVTLAALGPGAENVDWVIWKGRLFSAPGEATVGKGFLDLMGAEVGDTVQLPVLGKIVTLKIVGAYRATEDDGRWAMTSLETARQQIDPNLQAGGFAIALHDGADSRAAATRYRAAGATRIEVFDHEADGINAVRGVLGGLGIMLLLVGTVSLVNTISTGIRERRRDLGILKAIGFTPRQVVGGVLTGAGLLTGIALAVGIPLGVWASKAISDWLGDGLGWGPGLFIAAPATWLAAVVPVMLAAVVIASLIPATIAARTSASESLRHE